MPFEATMPDRTPWTESWEIMNARAWGLLKNSAELRPSLVVNGSLSYGHPRLRIWDDAMGFGCDYEPTSFTVFDPQDEAKQPLVRQAVWQRTRDLQRLYDLVEEKKKPVTFHPTFTVKDAEVPAGKFNEFLNSGARFRVPVVWLDPMVAVTCDVGSVGVEFFSLDQPPAIISLQWAFDKPADWEPVVDWTSQLRKFLELCLAANERS
jgi:hypothetical protein